MNFSLLICTLNRQELLCSCIKSLYDQSYKNFEIIIVDQSDKIKFDKTMFPSVCYIHIEKKGLSNARNVGLPYCNNDYLCLIDDDAIYPNNWLENINKILNKKSYDILAGRIQDPQTGAFAISGKDKKGKKVGFFSTMKYGASACTILKTDLAKKFGFDDRFGVGRKWGAGEETDLIWTMMENGAEMYYDPSIIIYHPVLNKTKIDINKIKSYNIGFGALFSKHYFTNRNLRSVIFCCYSLARNFVGIMLAILTKNQRMLTVQKSSIKSKIKGFMEYRNEN